MAGLGRELVRVLADHSVVPRLVAERPEEWRLGPLTMVVEGPRARLRYAREPVASVPARASEIARAWVRGVSRLRERSLAPDQLLPRLVAAYACLAKDAGQRVALVEVRAALPGYTRAQFAWDLSRMRRERRLVVDGHRIDFGVATGHATARRSRVVWIEDDHGGGMFYESLRLQPASVRP